MKAGIASLILALFAPTVAAPKEITVRSLLGEMVDLGRLASFPDPSYTSRQASSYDRRATSPTDNWFANGDYGNFLRIEHKQGRDEYVMADLKGPGAVTRIWSANPVGTLRIYVDGSELPELIANMEDLLSGKHADFPPPLSHRLANGANLYYPIPYAKSLKVTVTTPGGLYYHVNYRTYDRGARIQSFSMAQVKDAAKLTERIAQTLNNPPSPSASGSQLVTSQTTLEPGRILSLRTPPGEGEIREMQVTYSTPGDEALALRRTVVEADFDGESCISAPLGDLFATAPGAYRFSALPMSVDKGKLVSRWVMPQRNEGRFFFTNYSAAPVTLNILITWAPKKWSSGTMHFKAKWRRETIKTRPMRDWNFLRANSSPGRWVGAAMFIVNPTSDWWGEGDEKVYVDGETFPSTFGTGTEDYFGYAWSSPILFNHAYHNQIVCDGPGTRGNIAVNRFQIIDDIPWQQSMRFDMEIWHWRDVVADFGVTSYWYQKPGGTDAFLKITPADLVFFQIPPIFRVANAVEGETMTILSKTGGITEVQGLGESWSNGNQVWWRDAKPGDRIGFEVPATPGQRKLTAQFCAAQDYGLVQLYWNGTKLGEPIDFFNADGVVARKIDLGTVEAKATNVFEAEVIGANERAVKRYMFGVDYLLLQ